MIFNSVIAGTGGGGTVEPVEAKAVGSVTGAVEDDKVILIPTEIFAGGIIYDSYSYSVSGSSVPKTFQTGFEITLADTMRMYLNYSNATTYSTLEYKWNSDYSSFTRSETVMGEALAKCVNYRDSLRFTQRVAREGITYVGYTVDGEYLEFNLNGQYRTPQTIDYVSGYFKCTSEYDTNLYQLTPSGLVSIPAPNYYSRDPFMSKYNDTWYVVNGLGVYVAGTNTKAFDYSGFYPNNGFYGRRCQYVDNDVDYLFQYNTTKNMWEFKRIDKASTGWGETVLPSVTSALNACADGLDPSNWQYMSWPVLICKDFGDYVEMYVYSSHFSSSTQKLAHFIFTKATETIERLPDVFSDISGDWEVISANVNWDEGLACIDLTSSYGSANPKTFMHCVKKLDDMAGIYKYYAVENVKGNYLPSKSITGFVKSNEGPNELGDVVLKVNTAEDPNYIWTPPVDIIFGMNVTVNEGEPL